MSKSVVNCQRWTKKGISDGYSLHTRSCDIADFIEDYCKALGEVYQPEGTPYITYVSVERGDSIRSSKNGLRYYSENLPEKRTSENLCLQ